MNLSHHPIFRPDDSTCGNIEEILLVGIVFIRTEEDAAHARHRPGAAQRRGNVVLVAQEGVDGGLLRIADLESGSSAAAVVARLADFGRGREEVGEAFEFAGSCFGGRVLELVDRSAEQTDDENLEVPAGLLDRGAFGFCCDERAASGDGVAVE